MRLQGKSAIITGAARGSGREHALRFAREGAAVAVVYLRQEQGMAVSWDINAGGGNAVALIADVTSQPQMDPAAEQTLDQLGGIDVRRKYLEAAPGRRRRKLLQLSDLAGAAVYPAAEDSSMMTGRVLVVDDGRVMPA